MKSTKKPPSASRRFAGLQAGDDANLDEADALLRQSGDLLPDLPNFDDRSEPVWGGAPPLVEDLPLLTDVVHGAASVRRSSEPSFPRRGSHIPETEASAFPARPVRTTATEREPNVASQHGRLDFDSFLNSPSPSFDRSETRGKALHELSHPSSRKDPVSGHASLSTDFLIDDPRFETPYRTQEATVKRSVTQSTPAPASAPQPGKPRGSFIPPTPASTTESQGRSGRTEPHGEPVGWSQDRPTNAHPSTSAQRISGEPPPPPPPPPASSAFASMASSVAGGQRGLSAEQRAALETEISRQISHWVDHALPALIQQETAAMTARLRTEALAHVHSVLTPHIAKMLEGFEESKRR